MNTQKLLDRAFELLNGSNKTTIADVTEFVESNLDLHRTMFEIMRSSETSREALDRYQNDADFDIDAGIRTIGGTALVLRRVDDLHTTLSALVSAGMPKSVRLADILAYIKF